MGINNDQRGHKYNKRKYLSDRPVEIKTSSTVNPVRLYVTTGGLRKPTDLTPRPKVKGLANILAEHIASKNEKTEG